MINSKIYRYIPLLVILIIIFYSAFEIFNSCQANYIYPLDNSYIHLSLAKNFSNYGIWGVTKYEFSSSSSSILFTLILSIVMKIFGNNHLYPLSINIIFLYFVIYLIFNKFRPLIFFENAEKKQKIISGIILSSVVLIIILLIPMVFLTLSGMEHVLQILINLIFINRLIIYFEKFSNKNFIFLLFSSIFVGLVRYEGLFLILISLFFFIIKNRFKNGLILLIISVLPLLIYGLISEAYGSLIIANSIFLKSTKPENIEFIGIVKYAFSWIPNLIKEPHLLTIFISSAAILWLNIKSHLSLKDEKNLWLIFSIFLIIFHLIFAKTGGGFRYEAYIIAIGLIGIFINLVEIIKFGNNQLKNSVIILLIILIFTCAERAYKSFSDIKTMSRNVYEQQYQIAKFLKKNYNNSTVILSDIGCTTYFTDIKLIDLMSIGSIEPIKLRLVNKFNSEEINKLAKRKNAEIAILNKDLFKNLIPNDWIEIETWKNNANLEYNMDKITFYSANSENTVILLFNLEEFSKELPENIEILNF